MQKQQIILHIVTLIIYRTFFLLYTYKVMYGKLAKQDIINYSLNTYSDKKRFQN